jgi:membrane associated rhomboid family serine protease
VLSERDYMHQVRIRPRWPATIAILVLNVVVFGVQFVAERFFPTYPFYEHFALSLDGLKSGFIWQLLTFQLLHGGFLHIFLNSWAIFVFGREVEISIGSARMLVLYFVSGVAGGLLQMFGVWLMPQHFGDVPVVGASAGAFGLVAAYAVLFPNRVLLLLLFFVLPLKMRAKTLLWVSLAVAIVGIIWPFGNIGHAAHLGGILSGYAFARLLAQRFRAPPPTNEFF